MFSSSQMNGLVDVVVRAMKKLYRVQLDTIQGLEQPRFEIKPDGSLVTEHDKFIELYMLDDLIETFPGFSIMGEEGTRCRTTDVSGPMIVIDPLDGTRPFITGAPTSTVIVGIVDPTHGLVASVIGVVATGVVYSAFKDQPTQVSWGGRYGGAPFGYGKSRRVRVCADLLNAPHGHSQVFLDTTKGVNKRLPDGRTVAVITQRQNAALRAAIDRTARIAMLSSSGMHHALVAGGQPFCCGAFSTTVSPWDLAGLLCVINAGGFVQGYTLNPDTGSLMMQSGGVNHIDIMTADVAIIANSVKTLGQMQGWLAVALELRSFS